jgi:hypothetical protein
MTTIISDKIKADIETIRRSGETNMLDARTVFEIAVRVGYDELADLIFTSTKTYADYIFTGEG